MANKMTLCTENKVTHMIQDNTFFFHKDDGDKTVDELHLPGGNIAEFKDLLVILKRYGYKKCGNNAAGPFQNIEDILKV